MEEGSYSNQLNRAESNSVAYIEGNGNPRPKLLIIQYNSTSRPRVPFIIQVPARPMYSNNAIPLRYPTKMPSTIKENMVPEVTNIAKTRGVTRSRRRPTIYKERKGGRITQEDHDRGGSARIPQMIHHNDYEILDQLHKTLSRVSLLLLLINSKGHRELLLKVLNNAHVPQDITPEKFEASSIISLQVVTSHEVLVEGRSHNQPLHIAIKCDNYMIARMVIDNGSSLNVMPKATLDKLYCSGATLKNSPVVVKAFNGSKPEVIGEITLPICIGPKTSNITF
ncbi:hypothetical protein CR513_50805, partial [Mucuna pruriens]